MPLVKATIGEFVKYVNLWNIDPKYALGLTFRGEHNGHVVWSVGNVLVTGIDAAPDRVLFEPDNFDLRGADNAARKAYKTLFRLIREHFGIDDTPQVNCAHGVASRQVERVMRAWPVAPDDAPLNAETEAEFRERGKERHPDITEEELDEVWQDRCQWVEQQRAKREEQERRLTMTAEEAAQEWLAQFRGIEQVGGSITRSEIYPGKLGHFQGMMRRLKNRYLGGWTAGNGEKLVWDDGHCPGPDTVWSWRLDVILPTGEWDKRRIAFIEASEQYNGTVVEFCNGILRGDFSPVGAAFEQFAQMVVSEWSTEAIPTDDGTGDESHQTGDAPFQLYVDLMDGFITSGGTLVEQFKPERKEVGRVILYNFYWDNSIVGRVAVKPLGVISITWYENGKPKGIEAIPGKAINSIPYNLAPPAGDLWRLVQTYLLLSRAGYEATQPQMLATIASDRREVVRELDVKMSSLEQFEALLITLAKREEWRFEVKNKHKALREWAVFNPVNFVAYVEVRDDGQTLRVSIYKHLPLEYDWEMIQERINAKHGDDCVVLKPPSHAWEAAKLAGDIAALLPKLASTDDDAGHLPASRQQKGDFIQELTAQLDLPTFAGILESIDTLTVKQSEQKGALVTWDVSDTIGPVPLGHVTALPTKSGGLAIKFYRMEGDKPPPPFTPSIDIDVDDDGTWYRYPRDGWGEIMVNTIIGELERWDDEQTPADDDAGREFDIERAVVWGHNGETISDTPTDGSIIQLPDGELLQTKRVLKPLTDSRIPDGAGDEISNIPPNPRVEGWDALFDWYYHWQKTTGQRMTGKDLAKKIDYSPGYVRQKKSQYDAEHKPNKI